MQIPQGLELPDLPLVQVAGGGGLDFELVVLVLHLEESVEEAGDELGVLGREGRKSLKILGQEERLDIRQPRDKMHPRLQSWEHHRTAASRAV